jgi:integrase
MSSEFVIELFQKLKDKNLSDKSTNLYVKYLINLNNKESFNNLMFLKNTDDILKKLEKYSDNTKKTILSAITSILSLYNDKPVYKKLHKFYFELMMNKATDMKNIDSNVKTEKENKNWIEWEEIITIRERLKNEVSEFVNNKIISVAQYNKLLSLLVLSLYTLTPPRRNVDYIDMYFINHNKDSLDSNKNYLDYKNKKFIFNNYKTNKKYGSQSLEIPNDLLEIIDLYLKHHPLNPDKKLLFKKNIEFRFLVFSDGSPFNLNSTTRVLNKLFDGKRIGSSLLRHIYLSSKYDVNEMRKDADAMGHSVEEQRNYMKL